MAGLRFPVNTGPREEKRQLELGIKALAMIAVRHFDVHEGIWEVQVQFGTPLSIQSNLQKPSGEAHQYPAAVLPVIGVVLRRVEKVTDSSVDAAIVNAAPNDNHHRVN